MHTNIGPSTNIENSSTNARTWIRTIQARSFGSAFLVARVAGILLLTDGQSNAGEPPAKAAEFAAAEGIPVVAVAVGSAVSAMVMLSPCCVVFPEST